jgi:signal transduction histidine kinase
VEALERELSERQRLESAGQVLIRELSAKNEELERFAYAVSHDLKSPLITVRGFLGFLERDVLEGETERVRDDLVRIQEATRRMQRLVDELLELSRIGRRVNPPETLPFDEVAREAAGLVEGRLRARGVSVEIPAGLPYVHGDRPRLVGVVQNLLDNAAKFMGDQPSPRVEVGARTGDGTEPVFFVRDNGVGIEAPFQEKVFSLFEKLDPDSEGTGVGLALVRRIVEVHGGRIWIESAGRGQGTTFAFTLPFVHPDPGSGTGRGRRP